MTTKKKETPGGGESPQNREWYYGASFFDPKHMHMLSCILTDHGIKRDLNDFLRYSRQWDLEWATVVLVVE